MGHPHRLRQRHHVPERHVPARGRADAHPQRFGARSDARPPDNPPSPHASTPRAPCCGPTAVDRARQRQRRRSGAREGRLHLRDVVLGHGRRRQPACDLRGDLDRRSSRGRARTAARRSCREPPRHSTQDGVYGAEVVYDPADPLAPYRMWYSGRSGVFGAIGYATSQDGVTWVKWGHRLPGAVSTRPGRLGGQLQRRRPDRLEGRLDLEDVVHGRRLEQEAHRVRDVDRRRDLGQGRQGDRSRGSGREREHRVRRLRANGLEDRERLLDAAHRSQARRRRRLPDEDHGHELDGRGDVVRAEPRPQPVRLEHELRLLEPQLSRAAPGSRRTDALQALLLREHDRRERELPHPDRARDLERRQLVQQGERWQTGGVAAGRRVARHGVRRSPSVRPLGGGTCWCDAEIRRLLLGDEGQ